ncbi:MAG TPA: hypothetical protein VEG38_18490 [Acidimicrobiia bacterium]|nr:hypothetical protein [Acidimicrobiia bacterium]
MDRAFVVGLKGIVLLVGVVVALALSFLGRRVGARFSPLESV